LSVAKNDHQFAVVRRAILAQSITASTILDASATPFPAMSSAVP
jgi:hypothetical protein